MQSIHILARQLRKRIGAHNRMPYLVNGTADKWHEARDLSDEAERLAKYLVQNLASTQQATILANAAGVPAFLRLR